MGQRTFNIISAITVIFATLMSINNCSQIDRQNSLIDNYNSISNKIASDEIARKAEGYLESDGLMAYGKYYRNEAIEKALSEVNRALEVSNNNSFALRLLGKIYLLKGKNKQSEHAFLKAIESGNNEEKVLVYINMINLYLSMNKHNKIDEIYKEATRLDSVNASLISSYAFSKFAVLWENISKSKPESIHIRIKSHHDEITSIEKKFFNAIKADPTFYGSYNNLATVYMLKN